MAPGAKKETEMVQLEEPKGDKKPVVSKAIGLKQNKLAKPRATSSGPKRLTNLQANTKAHKQLHLKQIDTKNPGTISLQTATLAKKNPNTRKLHLAVIPSPLKANQGHQVKSALQAKHVKKEASLKWKKEVTNNIQIKAAINKTNKVKTGVKANVIPAKKVIHRSKSIVKIENK